MTANIDQFIARRRGLLGLSMWLLLVVATSCTVAAPTPPTEGPAPLPTVPPPAPPATIVVPDELVLPVCAGSWLLIAGFYILYRTAVAKKRFRWWQVALIVSPTVLVVLYIAADALGLHRLATGFIGLSALNFTLVVTWLFGARTDTSTRCACIRGGPWAMIGNFELFIAIWQAPGAARRANYQLFLTELCDVLDVPRPNAAAPDDAASAYVFEKCVPLPPGRIDLYRRGCFVLQARRGRDTVTRDGAADAATVTWDTARERARQRAQRYVRNLPAKG